MEFRTRPVKANTPMKPTTRKKINSLTNKIFSVSDTGTKTTASIDMTLNIKPKIKIAFCLGVLSSFSADILSSR